MENMDTWYERGRFWEYKGFPIWTRIWRNPGKPKLVLLHGFPTCSWDWYRLLPELEQRFEVYAMDLLGFGYSAKPHPYPYSLMDQASLVQNWLAYELADTDNRSVNLLAHDYGDTVAQELLARQADGSLDSCEITAAVLLNGGIIASAHKPRKIQRLLASPIGPLLAPRIGQKQFFRSFRAIFSTDHPAELGELQSYWLAINHNRGKRVMPKLLQYLHERKVHAQRWGDVVLKPAVPTMLINGLVDPISGGHLVEYLRTNNSQMDIHELPDVGHYPQLEVPDRVLAAACAFYDQHSQLSAE